MPKVNSDQIRDEAILTRHLSDEVVDSLDTGLDPGEALENIEDGSITLALLASEVTDAIDADTADGSITLAKLAAAVVQSLMPVGAILMWGTNTPPTSWLLLDGAAYSRTTYAGLFAIYGTTWGAGNGTTTFNIPNYVDYMPIGAGALAALAASGGAATVALTLANMFPHTHNGASHTHNGSSHTHSIAGEGLHSHTAPGELYLTQFTAGGSNLMGWNPGGLTGQPRSITDGAGAHDHGGDTGSAGTGATGASGTGATSSAGSGTAHENMPPHKGINFIIKA